MVKHHATTTKKRRHFIRTEYRVLCCRVLPGQSPTVVTRPKVRTGEDSFATRIGDVPVVYPYIQLSPVDLYDYATSAGVTMLLQTCLFNSARE